MTHKHNRRRIRPRHRNWIALSSQTIDDTESSEPSGLSPLPRSSSTPLDRNLNSISPIPRTIQRSSKKSGTVTAQHWQNRYNAWQRRDQAQKTEATKLEAEQYWLFGGEPGDDETLCYKMMEYFGGLDYIDT